MTNFAYGFQRYSMFPNPDLTKVVQGKPASDLEEYSARAIDKLKPSGWSYIFRIRINPITHRLSEKFTNLDSELEIDILAKRGNDWRPIQIDGQIGHYYTAWQEDVDNKKTAEINLYMRAYNAQPVVRVKYDKVANQRLADQYYRHLLI